MIYTIKKCLCPYCRYVWIRTKEGLPKGCPRCHLRFVGKKVRVLGETKL